MRKRADQPPGAFGWFVYGLVWLLALIVLTIIVFVILFYTGVDIVPVASKVKFLKSCDDDKIDCGKHDKGKMKCDCDDGSKWECKAQMFWSSSPKWKNKNDPDQEELSVKEFANGFGDEYCTDES